MKSGVTAPASPQVRSILWRLPGPDQTQPRPRAVIVGHHPELSAAVHYGNQTKRARRKEKFCHVVFRFTFPENSKLRSFSSHKTRFHALIIYYVFVHHITALEALA